jgi:hypothetical protein
MVPVLDPDPVALSYRTLPWSERFVKTNDSAPSRLATSRRTWTSAAPTPRRRSGEAVATRCELMRNEKVTRVGLEQPLDSSGNHSVFNTGGANSGAFSVGTSPLDPDLARILDAWPILSPPIRAAMLALTSTALPVAPATPQKAAE